MGTDAKMSHISQSFGHHIVLLKLDLQGVDLTKNLKETRHSESRNL